MLASSELEVTITKFHFCTAKCIAGAVCCCKNYIAITILLWSLKSILIDCSVSELHAHLCPYIVMYGLRLFIVVLRCLPNYLRVCMIRVRCCNHFTKFCCSTLSGSDIAKCIA